MEVILGTIVGIFGVHGEVKVKSNTDFAKERYQKGNKVIVYSPYNQNKEFLKIEGYRSNKGLDILLFEGLNNPNLVEKYIGYQILIEKPKEDLKSDTYYYADLWQCEVFYQNEKIGMVIDMFDSGSHLILRIQRPGKKDLLYPFVKNFIKNVDIDAKKIELLPIKGMIEE